MNKLFIVGRIGRDAELRSTQNGTAVASFPVAVDVGYGENKSTQWYNCAIFGKRAESKLVGFLVKGKEVVIDGEPKLNTYQNQAGEFKASIEVRINDVQLVGGHVEAAPQQVQQNTAQNAPQAAAVGQQFVPDEDVPF